MRCFSISMNKILMKGVFYETYPFRRGSFQSMRAKENTSVKSIIFYIHGAGWVFGSFHTHEKLVRELSARTNSLIVFPEYTRSPEVRFPTAIHQCYYLLCRLP